MGADDAQMSDSPASSPPVFFMMCTYVGQEGAAALQNEIILGVFQNRRRLTLEAQACLSYFSDLRAPIRASDISLSPYPLPDS